MIKPGTASEQLFFTTARLQCHKSDKAWSGTGFFVRIPVTNGPEQTVLVTNQHVASPPGIGDVEDLQIIGPAGINNTDQSLLGQHAIIKVENPVFVTHPTDDVDVAVMGINDLSTIGPHPIYVKPFALAFLLNGELLEILTPSSKWPLSVILTVFTTQWTWRPLLAVVGPLHLYHSTMGGRVFLIDASVFPGSSGSPVLIVNQGSYTNRHGGMVLASRVIMLGIVSAGYLHQVTGELVPALELPRVAVKQMMNLGIVYKTRTILEAIDQFLKSKGLSRAMAT
jgi:hypothetical protein